MGDTGVRLSIGPPNNFQWAVSITEEYLNTNQETAGSIPPLPTSFNKF